MQQTIPGQYNWGFGNYNATHDGLPEWGNDHVGHPQNDNSDWMGDSYRRCCTANAWVGQILAARMMNLQTDWNHPDLFDYQDRYMGIAPVGDWTRSWDPWVVTMWDAYRPQY